ncbi:Xaa-Pro aminopeptidase [Dyadobacter jejuensis]|uniref:Xaa-Pro aminopeptidase n=1 Tax=Dyadobacter jejuensis TaxID=1082580 RepID=A0A316ATP3_9BACT|nr:aminopeptidase P family protein [Dyadobacter jejuensis]PWJ60659.1 Xaa-Pro aminopeptidase [Dyadobacter jejuensis]
MRYSPIDPQLFKNNRQRLYTLLKPKALAILQANDVLPTNADGSMPFKQNADFFHLTGVDQEESIVLLFPDHPNPKYREVLFLRETNETIAVWEGEKLSKAQGTAVSGIHTIFWTHQFDRILSDLVFEAQYVYLNTNEHTRNDSATQTRDARFIDSFKRQFPLHHLERIAPLMHMIRSVKHPIEVNLLQKACNITRQGFERVLSFVKPGVQEFEIEAELLHEFVRNRSKGFAYQPIIASGANACVLHYIQNDQPCKDGDVILLDVAAEYANYNSDLSRSIPANGRFTPRQRAVYDAVLRVFKAAKGMLVVGNTLDAYHQEVGQLMQSELKGLGLLNDQDIARQDPDWPAYKKYFPHGTSHFLGLDVHDVGNKYQPFTPGMVFTCEPGIYIREEGLGIRLENNLLITEQGAIDLMADIPIEAEEIEDLMNQRA